MKKKKLRAESGEFWRTIKWGEEQSHYSYDGNELLKNGKNFEVLKKTNELLEEGLSLKAIADQLSVPFEDLAEEFPDFADDWDDEE